MDIKPQYVAVIFREGDTRTYTYANHGEPLAAGDLARVDDVRGGGWKKVVVVGVTDEAPPFQCKPILGRHYEPGEEPAAPTQPSFLQEARA